MQRLKTSKLRVDDVRPTRANNKAEAIVGRKYTNAKNQQLRETVQYCFDNNVRGHTALKTGKFHLIKDRETINRRLDGKIKTGKHLHILFFSCDLAKHSKRLLFSSTFNVVL